MGEEQTPTTVQNNCYCFNLLISRKISSSQDKQCLSTNIPSPFSLKIPVLWDVSHCSLVNNNIRIKEP
jgi:hypothetical protein